MHVFLILLELFCLPRLPTLHDVLVILHMGVINSQEVSATCAKAEGIRGGACITAPWELIWQLLEWEQSREGRLACQLLPPQPYLHSATEYQGLATRQEGIKKQADFRPAWGLCPSRYQIAKISCDCVTRVRQVLKGTYLGSLEDVTGGKEDGEQPQQDPGQVLANF